MDLQADRAGLLSKDVDIEEYVRHVYGVSTDDIEAIKAKEWKLDGLATYVNLLGDGAREEQLYEPFKAIMANLFCTFENDKRKLDVHHAFLGKTALKSVGNVRKPDQLFFFGSHDDNSPITWSLAKAFVELAVTPSAQRITASGSAITTINEEEAAATHALAASAPDLILSPTIVTPSGGTKRRSTDTPDRSEASKRAKISVLSKKEPQAAGYALELLASTCRRWATGLVIIDTQVALHYYDRVGAIFTQPFKFDEEPWKLALFALAIGQCNLVQAGFEPLVASNTNTTLSQPLYSLKDAILQVPEGEGKEGKAQGGDLNDGIEFVDKLGQGVYSHFEITGDPLYVYGGLTGRGSHVLPGDLVKVGEVTPQDNTGTLDDSKKRPATTAKPKGAMVVKLSWPMEKRPYLEADTINDLLKKIAWMEDQLPRIHCAITLKGESMELPRHLFHNMTTAHNLERRYFTLLFTDRYKHLWDVETLAEFQLAYIDIVECHHAATKYGRILHRDISENNLLWTRRANGVFGVLNDWDLATPINAICGTTNHRTGTGPFMALDLLDKVPAVHLYRHDLESLFYVLIWAAVHYNIGDTVPYLHQVDPELEKWNGNYEDARAAKTLFYENTEPVMQRIRPAMLPLRAIWIKPLCDLFQKSRANARILRAAQAQPEVVVPSVLQAARGSQLMDARNARAFDESDSDSDDEQEVLPPPPGPSTPVAPPVAIDFETLGCLTFENFLAALDGCKPRRIPKKYREQAKRLLEEL
ncbi:hypothetical protein PC9H_011639 [Pleurotus ostreatus]|uniref:Protein kinase domain-containing protein n=1 Tax=Pleurotus ostreatus TaxID=5322 RepID=A0A8H6ZJ57_PLEOS|nr:uncharacterized protein PC9H_011639 [Pleurotus ostreatus]KAF7421119.1 hypothetical protein PC9H_011639 [Pleurotus ostreatus]KAJ8690643.1 hypothetical protein PTI98_012054 [Pleurotus ostreatus]